MNDLTRVEQVLKAVANKRRLQIMQSLKKGDELTVDDTAKLLNLSFRATSKHLVVLYRAGVLRRNQKDRFAFYSLTSDIPTFVRSLIKDL